MATLTAAAGSCDRCFDLYPPSAALTQIATRARISNDESKCGWRRVIRVLFAGDICILNECYFACIQPLEYSQFHHWVQNDQAKISKWQGPLISPVNSGVHPIKEKCKVNFTISLLSMQWEKTVTKKDPPSLFAMARCKGLTNGDKVAAMFTSVRVPVMIAGSKSCVEWSVSDPCKIEFQKTFITEHKNGDENGWKQENMVVALLAAKAPFIPQQRRPQDLTSKKPQTPTFLHPDFEFCNMSINLTKLLTDLLPLQHDVTIVDESIVDGCKLNFEIQVSPNSEKTKAAVSSKDTLSKLHGNEVTELRLKLSANHLYWKGCCGCYIGIVPEQTVEPLPCTLFHRKSFFEVYQDRTDHCIGIVTKVKHYPKLDCVSVDLKLLEPKAWRDSMDTTVADYSEEMKKALCLLDECVYCVFKTENAAEDDVKQAQTAKMAALNQENERHHRNNQDLISKAIEEKDSVVTVDTNELGTVVMRTGFLLAQPVISSIVQQIMRIPNLGGLSERDKNCLHLFGSKDGPWDIFYMFDFLHYLFAKTQSHNTDIFGRPADDVNVRIFDTRQERIKHVIQKIRDVRNWWAHVGVSCLDCLNALTALKDFIQMAKEVHIHIDGPLLFNFNELTKVTNELRLQYSGRGSISMSIDEMSYLYLIRAFRRIVETCEKILKENVSNSTFSTQLKKKLQLKRERNQWYRQSGILEATDVAHVVKNMLQDQLAFPNLTISLNDCRIIVKARNTLAHEPQQSGKVLAMLCALGSSIRLLEFISNSAFFDDTRDFAASSIDELRYYQARLLVHISPSSISEADVSKKFLLKTCFFPPLSASEASCKGIFRLADLIRRVCLSHSVVIDANCYPGKKLIRGDFQMFQLLLTRKIKVSKSISEVFKCKAHRKLMQIAARVPSCYTTARDAVEWMFSYNLPRGFLDCNGLKLAYEITRLQAEHAARQFVEHLSSLPKISDKESESVAQELVMECVLRAMTKIESIAGKHIVQAIQDAFDAHNDYRNAVESFQAALEAEHGRCDEPPSADDDELVWTNYMQKEVSDQHLKHRVQATRDCISDKDCYLRSILTSENIVGIKDSLVRFIDETSASILSQVPGNVGFSGFMYLRLQGLDSYLPSWTMLQKLLPYYFGSNDSADSFPLGIDSINDPSSCYPFFNFFSRKDTSFYEPLFVNSLKILSPLLDFCTANLNIYSKEDALKLEVSLGPYFFDSLVYLACLSSSSFKHEMTKWYQEKKVKTRMFGNWGNLSAIGFGDAKFAGRQDELGKLDFVVRPFFSKNDRSREMSQKTSVILIGGQPGMGKTALARHYLNQIENDCFHESSVVGFSLQGRGKADVQDGLKNFASIVLTLDQLAMHDILSKLKEFLSKNRYLLFVDDIDEIGLEELMLYVPKSSQGGIIILTSQIQNLVSSNTDIMERAQNTQCFSFEQINLVKFSSSDALNLVKGICNIEDSPALQSILGEHGLDFLPVGVRVFSSWLKEQLDNGSVDPLQQWVDELSTQQETAESFQGYRGLKTTVKLCAARLEQNICEKDGQNADESLLKHFGVLWLLSMCKPVQTPWSFFCVPAGDIVRGSMVLVHEEAFLDTTRTPGYMSPKGEYVRSVDSSHRDAKKDVYRIFDDKVYFISDKLDVNGATCSDPHAAPHLKEKVCIRVKSVINGSESRLEASTFVACDGEVVFEIVGDRWMMRSKFNLARVRWNWGKLKDEAFVRLSTDAALKSHPLNFLSHDQQKSVIGRVIRYHPNNLTASVLLIRPDMQVPGPMTDKDFLPDRDYPVDEEYWFQPFLPSVVRFPVDHLQAFQPERNHILQLLKTDVVGLNSSIYSVAKTLQESGLVHIDEDNRTFDMHQLLQQAVHETFYGTLRRMSEDTLGFSVMKSLLCLQFGSPFDEISYTKRRLTHIMRILDTAEVVLKHRDFLRRETLPGKELNWQEAMLMRLHEISILASSTSSVTSMRLLDTIKSVNLIQSQWSSSVLLQLDERQTLAQQRSTLAHFDCLWQNSMFELNDVLMYRTLIEWNVYASNLFMLRGDREFDVSNRIKNYKRNRLSILIHGDSHSYVDVSWHLLWDQLEPIKCFQYWQESLYLRIQCLGINHPYTARAYHRIARAFLDLHIPYPAVLLLNAAKRILAVSLCDEKHFEFGNICCDMGRALELLLQKEHSDIWYIPREHCGSGYQPRAPNAENVHKQFKDALTFQKERSDTLDVAATLSFSGCFDARQGNFDRAIESLEKSLRIQANLIAPRHFALHDNRFMLALLYGIKGNEAKAQEHYHDAALDRKEHNKMQAWSHLSMMADSLQSNHGPMITPLMHDGALQIILADTNPNLLLRDKSDLETLVAIPFARRLLRMTECMSSTCRLDLPYPNDQTRLHYSGRNDVSIEFLSSLCLRTIQKLNSLGDGMQGEAS